uniref:MBL fold metallo-hydrolase n=1 Tax=Acetatifactor sp. TaxID=1872090 RepID=UPI0040570BC2
MGYFTSEKLNEYVTRITCPGNVYAFLVEGENSAALIDTGFGVGSLKEYVGTLTKLPYVVLLTHAHLDHAGGAGEFEKVYLNEKDMCMVEQHTSLEKRIESVKGGNPDIPGKDFIPPLDLGKYVSLINEQSFDLGGVTVTMLAMPGHTPGSMCMLVDEARAVLLGDACNSLGFLQLPGSSCVEEYRDSLLAFNQYADRFDEVWYSHPHNFGGKEIIEETIKLCEELISGERVGIHGNAQEKENGVFRAKPTDEKDRPLDGSISNFLYKSIFRC